MSCTRSLLPVAACRESAAMDSNRHVEILDFLQSCKRIHLVRHAQGIHNVEAEKNIEGSLSHRFFDAELSPKGWQQVGEERKRVRENGLFEKVELVITSPLQRTMQTAVGIFGEDKSNVADAVSKPSNIKQLPIIAVELCRERTGRNPSDKRKSISKYRSQFPKIDFSLIENEDDVLWHHERREDLKKVAERGLKFLKWLLTRPEREIVVVSHGIFLQQTLFEIGRQNNVCLKDERFKRFGNCEFRSFWIDERTCGYGKILPGIDFHPELSKEAVLSEESEENRNAASVPSVFHICINCQVS